MGVRKSPSNVAVVVLDILCYATAVAAMPATSTPTSSTMATTEFAIVVSYTLSAIILTIVIQCRVLKTGAECDGFARLIVGFYYVIYFVPLSFVYTVVTGVLVVIFSPIVLLSIFLSAVDNSVEERPSHLPFRSCTEVGNFVFFPWRTDFHDACLSRGCQQSAAPSVNTTTATATEHAVTPLFRPNAVNHYGIATPPHNTNAKGVACAPPPPTDVSPVTTTSVRGPSFPNSHLVVCAISVNAQPAPLHASHPQHNGLPVAAASPSFHAIPVDPINT